MRAWEIQDGETAKSFAAFGLFRDLGPGRTLREAAGLFYGGEEGATDAQYDQFRLWSRTHDWQERVRHFDSWLDFEKRAAVQEHLNDKAEDHARREVALCERALAIREALADQAMHMARWPLSRQERVVEAGLDGEEVKYVFVPSGWTKATAVSFLNAVVGHAEETAEEVDHRLDYSVLSDDELMLLDAAMSKVLDAPRLPPERSESGR